MVVRLDVSRAHDHTARVDYLRTGTHGLLAHAHVSNVTAGDGDVAREQFAGVHVRDGAAPHEEVGWPLATRRLQKPPAHFLAQAQTVSPRALAPLLRNVADDVTFQSPDPPLPDEVLEMGERLRSEEHTSELQSRQYLVCRLLLEKKKKKSNPLFPTKKKTEQNT